MHGGRRFVLGLPRNPGKHSFAFLRVHELAQKWSVNGNIHVANYCGSLAWIGLPVQSFAVHPGGKCSSSSLSNDTGGEINYLRAKRSNWRISFAFWTNEDAVCLIFDTRCVLRMVNSQWLSLTLEVLCRFRVTETLYFELRTRGSSTGLRTLLLAVSC
jgi:hypothetical protein